MQFQKLTEKLFFVLTALKISEQYIHKLHVST